jgi:soluble lytic murein transglycosylase-like protein
MNREHALALTAVGLGAVGLIVWQNANASSKPSTDSGLTSSIDYTLSGLFMNWQTALQPGGRGYPYAAAFTQAEQENGLPANLLARQSWQESRYNPSAYNSGSNATGIMQIVPSAHPDVDPTDPFASIAYAGNWMGSLFRQFGSWSLALMAYNWGPGNVNKYLAGTFTTIPTETDNYYSSILADISTADGVTIT